jgi:GDP-L-fucose synthase
VLGFAGEIELDHSKPDGTPRKLMDNSRLVGLGWRPTTGLQEGIACAYQDFLARYEAAAASASC